MIIHANVVRLVADLGLGLFGTVSSFIVGLTPVEIISHLPAHDSAIA